MPHRGIATLSAALMLSFLYLTHLETQFFLLHFYQSLIYLAIILMLFYFEEQYAYMLGMLAPAAWIVMTSATGLLGGGARQAGRLLELHWPTNDVSLMAAVIGVLSVADDRELRVPVEAGIRRTAQIRHDIRDRIDCGGRVLRDPDRGVLAHVPAHAEDGLGRIGGTRNNLHTNENLWRGMQEVGDWPQFQGGTIVEIRGGR